MNEKAGNVPMTRQIVEEIGSQIQNGVVPSGARLPSVRELAARYGISTAVCLSAYRHLEKKRLVERRAGSGTYVCELSPREDRVNRFYSWSCVMPPLETGELARTLSPELQVSLFPASTYEYNPKYLEWLLSRSSGAETHPGLAALNEGQLPCLASRGALLPLDELLDASKVIDRSKFPPELLRSMSWNGRLYALPVAYNPFLLFYNRRIFRLLNLPEPDESWKWQTLREHTEILTRREGDAISRYGLALLFTPNAYTSFIFQNNGEFFDRNGNCAIDSDDTFEALAFFSELYRLPGVCSHRHGDPRSALVELLSNDLAAMLIGDGIDYAMLCERMPAGSWGMTRLPAGRCRATSLSVLGFGLTAGSRADERFALLERSFRPELYPDFCGRIHTLPAYDPARHGVPPLLTELLPEARPSIQSISPNAFSAVAETLNLLLAHKLSFTRAHCRDFQRKINARLNATD